MSAWWRGVEAVLGLGDESRLRKRRAYVGILVQEPLQPGLDGLQPRRSEAPG